MTIWISETFHIAIWVDDLVKLNELGYVIGFSPRTEREWEEARSENLIRVLRENASEELPEDFSLHGLVLKLADGTTTTLMVPALPEPDPDELEMRDHAGFKGPISASKSGRSHLHLAIEQKLEFPPELQRCAVLLEQGFCDTAVREGSVILESVLRRKLGLDSTVFGQKLVDRFVARAKSEVTNFELRLLSTQLRSTFRFIRNNVAHNVVDLERRDAVALLFRIITLLQKVGVINFE